MKIPLRFQATECDCATATVQNALSYLFERENIPPETMKEILLYTMDQEATTSPQNSARGTSKAAMSRLALWLAKHQTPDFHFELRYLTGPDVTEDVLTLVLQNGGCVILRTHQAGEHYVLATGIDDQFVYLWDPYYFEPRYYDTDKSVEIVFDQPLTHNRKVAKNRLLAKTKSDFALGPLKDREALALWR